MENENKNFIEHIIDEDLAKGKNGGKVETRFPPEPNGYLHIGHAKSICLNFGLAKKYNGVCHLRFDDTNPEKESEEYINSIMEDVKWLGFDWGKHLYFASSYFDKLYEYAIELIKKGLAYVDDLSAEEIREYRGTLTKPGKNSPYRNRSVEENLELFERMKNGEFKDGEKVLRAKIDMASPNINMRDPVIYRIKHATHPKTGDKWCIYPMYDFTHPISDALEHITHSICTLEFEDHRPLYNWMVENTSVPSKPRQIEFARLNLTYTVMSKRKLLRLVEEGYVEGWDDPRMPTISGMRRRGYTPVAIRNFADAIGVAKADSIVDIQMLEHFVREDLNENAPRAMAVLDPLKVVITNYPENKEEIFEGDNHPNRPEMGKRKIPFSRVIYIEREDFMENPPKKFFRLAPGREVRLKHAYYITCDEVIKDEKGEIVELHCTYDPASRGGWTEDGRKVRGTLHWVSEKDALSAEVRIYNHLFTKENPNITDSEDDDFIVNLNQNSLEIIKDAKIEPSLANAKVGESYQFLRKGYFCLDKTATHEHLVFNRTVSLKDSWAKKMNK